MAFEPASRDWTMIKVPTKASVTYSVGMMLYSDETDNVPTVAATQNHLLGIAQEAKASSSTTTDIHVRIPNSPASTFYGDMESGETLSRANVGDQFDFAAGGLTISTTSTYDTVQLVKYISTTKGVFRFNTLHGKD